MNKSAEQAYAAAFTDTCERAGLDKEAIPQLLALLGKGIAGAGSRAVRGLAKSRRARIEARRFRGVAEPPVIKIPPEFMGTNKVIDDQALAEVLKRYKTNNPGLIGAP